MKLPHVVVFGAGNIGRGFLGQLFTEAGWEVVFVDVHRQILDALDARRSYPLRLVGPDRFETLQIGPVRALDARRTEEVADAIAGSRLVCTAVGAAALRHVAAPLAAGLNRREAPLDVLLCENQWACSRHMREYLAAAEPSWTGPVGLVECVVSRMVPVLDAATREADPLLAVAEDYPRLPVDADALLGEPPPVPGIVPVAPFEAWYRRKLYVHNLGHAVAAYLGYLEGAEYIHQAVEHPRVRAACAGAMDESCEALARAFPLEPAELAAHRADLLRRFGNAALCDTVARVGRDPERKLAADDRLVGAARFCMKQGVAPRWIARGIAAALRFGEAAPDALPLAERRRREGVGPLLASLCGLSVEEPLGELILTADAELNRETV